MFLVLLLQPRLHRFSQAPIEDASLPILRNTSAEVQKKMSVKGYLLKHGHKLRHAGTGQLSHDHSALLPGCTRIYLGQHRLAKYAAAPYSVSGHLSVLSFPLSFTPLYPMHLQDSAALSVLTMQTLAESRAWVHPVHLSEAPANLPATRQYPAGLSDNTMPA